ncbi:MAG: autotransporter domain-containing protein [Pseudomonadota bacterium]
MHKGTAWRAGLWLGASIVAMTGAAPALGAVQSYGLNIPSAGALDFGQINPATGTFTFFSHLPNGLVLPLEVYAANPIVGEFYLPTSTGTLAIEGQFGTSRSLSSNLTILGFDVANDRLIADNLDGTGHHIVSIDPVSLTQVQKSPAFAPIGQPFVSAAAAVNSINREVYTLSGSTLLVTNLDTGAAIRSVALSQNVAGTFAFDPVNGTLYDFATPSVGDFRLASIDPTTGHVSVISAANVLSGGIANQGRSLSIVDGVIYVQSLSGVYDIVDLATGTLKSSFTSTAAAIFPQDQVVLGGASNSTFAFNITNPNAALYKVGSGTVVLTGANSNTGGTSILGGTLQIGNSGTNGSIVGDVTNNGSLVFDRSDFVIFAGAISGTGSLVQTGGGTLRLEGANTYTGGTLIGAGSTLATFGDGIITGTLAGNVIDNGALVFGFPNTVIFPGIISGTGSVGQSVGTLILTGANTYTGGTDTGTGTIRVGNGGTTGSIVGDVLDRTSLVFDRSDAVTFAGTVSGIGSLTQVGSGTLTLTGTNTYAGLTNVNAGTLAVTGAVGTVTVASGGTLTGTGKVGGTTIASGGRFSPGATSGAGTLTVNGNLTLAAGATSFAYLTPTTNSAANVTGMASLDGALVVGGTPGTYVIGQRYTLLTATGGISGSYASLSTAGLPPAYIGHLGYDANDAYFFVDANAITPLLPAGVGGNGVRAAKAIDAAIAGGATLNSGFNALFGLSGAALGSAMAQISGEAGADAAQGGSQAFLPFISTLTAEGGGGSATVTAANFAPASAYGEDGAPKPAQLAVGATRIWGSAYGRHTGIAADPVAGTQSLKAGDAGFAAGIEMQVSDHLRLGAAAGGGHGSFRAGNGQGTSNDAMLGLYGNFDVADQGYVAGAFSYGWHDIDTLRFLAISGTDLLSAKYTAHDVGARIEGGWRVALDEQDGLVPYAAFVWDDFRAPGYGEHAASGSANFTLSYAAHDSDFGHSELGLKAGRRIDAGAGILALELSAAWAHELYGAPFALATFQALPGSSFVVQGGRIAGDTALLGAGLDWSQDNGLAFGARIDSQLGGGTTAIAGTGTISLHW